MSKSDIFETDFLKLILNATPIGGIADNAATSPLTVLWLSLHTADPGEGGTQLTSEVAYTGYGRTSVNRSGGGWNVNNGVGTLMVDAVFPTGTGGSGTATYFGVGTSQTGAGKLLWSGTVTPNIPLGNGVA